MRRTSIVNGVLAAAVLPFVLLICAAHAWQIDSYDVDIARARDSSFIVTETITADFGAESRHGIIRDIPVTYRNEKGARIDVSFTTLSVTDASGAAWEYRESYVGNAKSLKIGSPYRTLNGPQTFVIRYLVQGALLFLPDHDELFWNALGTDWDVPVASLRTTVRLPFEPDAAQLKTAAFSGRFGARESKVDIRIADARTVVFSGSGYGPGEGVTIVVGWPKGLVTPPPYKVMPSRAAGFAFPWFPFMLGLSFPCIAAVIMYVIWSEEGKDPSFRKTMVVEYAPPQELRPAEIGALMDDRLDPRDISSTIIDLAVRGYLVISSAPGTFGAKSFSFQLRKEFSGDKDLKEYERFILKGIFESGKPGIKVELEDLENRFYSTVPAVKDDLFARLQASGYYAANPEKTAGLYYGYGIMIAVIGVMITRLFVAVGLGVAAAGAVVVAFGRFMPAKTRKGMDTYGKILGFEEFLSRTDRDKISREEQQGIFERMLPYAMCLGIASQWARSFEGLYQVKTPEWYQGNLGTFTTRGLISDLDRSVAAMHSSLYSTPRSVSSGGGFSGGGFSGGGFGGGGGRSW
jgi:hypothetical protein